MLAGTNFATLTIEAEELLVDNTEGSVSYALVEYVQVDGEKDVHERVIFASTSQYVSHVWETRAGVKLDHQPEV